MVSGVICLVNVVPTQTCAGRGGVDPRNLGMVSMHMVSDIESIPQVVTLRAKFVPLKFLIPIYLRMV